MLKEKIGTSISGWWIIWFAVAVSIVGSFSAYYWIQAGQIPVFSILIALLSLVNLLGLFTMNPNEGKVLQFFGSYIGTVRTPGLRWSIPFFSRRSISLRVRNFESSKLKVNDSHGNPIEIASVVVWRVIDTAQALFEVDSYEDFVKIQSESAVRNLAMSYPYDAHDGSDLSLLGSPEKVTEHLKAEIQERLSKAGVQVIEARISHLAYAAEIAASMLQRQQASAIVAARQKIVEGAVGMVEMALNMLSSNKIVELDEERKALRVSNLLVVLCGERSTQPIVNAGTIY